MKRIDTDVFKTELAALYADLSKHSVYQSIPDFVADVVGYQVQINESWRGDRVRLDYIRSHLADAGLRRWGDFGANTGYFSLSLAQRSAQRQITAIEANPNHARFIRRIAEVFELDNLQVIGRPIAIDDLMTIPRQDVLLHLNVLHHAGADFDQGRVTGAEDFLSYAHEYLQRLCSCTDILVFQMGTNLWGDKAKPIIDYRNDVAKYGLLSELLTRSGWRIDDVAYAAWENGQPIRYRSLTDAEDLHGVSPTTARVLQTALDGFSLSRHIGEFYRRPLFICSS